MVRLRVLTLNVRYAGLDVGSRTWAKRRDAVVEALSKPRPDVVCLQELRGGQLANLRTRLDLRFLATRIDGAEHTAIGYRPEPLDICAWGTFALAPSSTQRTPAWDAALPRFATCATFETADERVTVFSVHLDHTGPRARREGARLLATRAEKEDRVVVAGDLNCEPGAPAHRALTDAELQDARTTAATVAGPRATYHGFGEEDPRVLDHVLVRGFDVERFAVADPEGRISDHRPIVVDLV